MKDHTLLNRDSSNNAQTDVPVAFPRNIHEQGYKRPGRKVWNRIGVSSLYRVCNCGELEELGSRYQRHQRLLKCLECVRPFCKIRGNFSQLVTNSVLRIRWYPQGTGASFSQHLCDDFKVILCFRRTVPMREECDLQPSHDENKILQRSDPQKFSQKFAK